MTTRMKTDGPQMDLFLAAPARGAAARPAPKATKATKPAPAPKKAAAAPPKGRAKPPVAATAPHPVAPEPAVEEAAAVSAPADAGPTRRRETAESIGKRQREISVAEFFQKNRHLLGFDNPQKALLTATKEAVDNSLDACEEAGILPSLEVEIEEKAEDRFRLAITDNGPGIMRNQIPKVFGKLLYGSKFHTMRQSRGQQGIGISAAGMYSQLTTGQPVRITSRTAKKKPAHYFEISIDTTRNEPKIIVDREVEWDRDHGTKVEMELAGLYKKGRRSVDDYVVQTALANPHADVHYVPPKGDPFHRERLTKELPREPLVIKPHPYGVELGILISMLQDSKSRTVSTALQSDFARVSDRVALEICKVAGVNPNARPRSLPTADIESLFRAIPKVKIMAPPTNVIVPIGEELILEGLKQTVKADFYASATRPPAVYRGNPFLIEVGLAYGGGLPAEEPITLYRYANRVPLQYQQGACAITKAVSGTDWKSYQLQQPRGALPLGPMLLMVHIASVWVPFTSESKEAIAHYPEIIKEMRLALQECGRRVAMFIRKRRRDADEAKKRAYIEKYIPQVSIGLQQILELTDPQRDAVTERLTQVLERSRKL